MEGRRRDLGGASRRRAEEKGHGSDRCLFTAGEERREETGGVVSDQLHADLDLEGERPKKKVSACGETETAQTHRNRKAKVRLRKNKSQQPVSHANTARRNSSPVLFLVFFTARYLCLGAAPSTLGPYLDFIGCKIHQHCAKLMFTLQQTSPKEPQKFGKLSAWSTFSGGMSAYNAFLLFFLPDVEKW